MRKPLACYFGIHSLTFQSGWGNFYFCQRPGCYYGYPPEWSERP